jgi:hypothetical protein
LWHGGLHTSFPLYTEALRARLANSTLKRGRSGPHGGAAKRLPKFLSGVSNHRHDAQASNSVTANPITRGKEWPDQPLRRRSGRQGQRQSSAPPGLVCQKAVKSQKFVPLSHPRSPGKAPAHFPLRRKTERMVSPST